MLATILPRSPIARRGLRCTFTRNNSTIRTLQAAFRDPSSPFHIPPGTQGPSSPHPPVREKISTHSQVPLDSNNLSAADNPRTELLGLGFDPESFWEQHIVWGDHDAFQHVNNVHYVRFFESGRVKWLRSIGNELGGPSRADAMCKAQGISLILKSIEVRFKRPVTYPDTLLIAHKPYSSLSSPETQFNLSATAYSYSQRAIVCESDAVLVWYDYDRKRKCVPGEEIWEVVRRRFGSSRRWVGVCKGRNMHRWRDHRRPFTRVLFHPVH